MAISFLLKLQNNEMTLTKKMEMAEVALVKQSCFTYELVQDLQVFQLEKLLEEMVS